MKCPRCHSDVPSDTRFCSNCGAQLIPAEEISFPPTETLQKPMKKLSRGSTFASRYEVIEELGKGGMGKVYRVFDKKIEEEVALKLLNPEIAADKKTIERFRNELKFARKISHRNVCRMYDLSEEEGTHYITMEYVPGEDLKSTITRVGQLSVGKTIFIARQVCEGLAEAHGLGVVHRDLKPQNIMIDKEGNARIMDFGIARSLKAKGITGAGVMIGTPEYMSPEQAEVKEVDQRSDIYSLGVILYEMVTGRVPFEGETPLSIAMKHKSEEPPNPKQVNAQIPDDLSRVILRCMEKDKDRRYQSAREILSELTKIEKGIPTTERIIPKRKPITSKEITVKFSLKKLIIPVVVILAVIVVALMLFRPRGLDVDPNRVVVAVFENQTGDSELDPLGRMASDWITQGLSQTGLVAVAPLPPAEVLKGLPEGKDSIRLLAQETGAGKVVSGAYYLQGETIRFHAQVTDVKEGKLLSALDPVSGPVDDPIKPIESLRQRVMGALATVFDPKLKPFVDIASQPPTYEAYREYMEGGKFFIRREYKKAIEHLSRAAALDSTFVLPLLMAAVAHNNLGEYAEADALADEVAKFREKLSPKDQHWIDWLNALLRGDNAGQLHASRQLALLAPGGAWNYQVGLDASRNNHPQEAVEALKALDPERGWMKGWFYYWGVLTEAHHMLGNHKQELKEARRGRRQYPNTLSTLWYEAKALAALGQIKEVNKIIDESLAFPPQKDWNPAWVMIYSGREMRVHGYQEASLQVLERAVRWLENRSQEEKKTESHRRALAYAYYYAERWEEAHAVLEVLHKEFPDNINYLGSLGTLAARKGNKEEAVRISNQLENIKRPYLFGSHTYFRARIAALLGEKERAVMLLREALGQGAGYTWLHPDMNLEPLHDYPPFKELIKPKG